MGQATAIDPSIGKIETDLKKLWEVQREKNQLRACLFNLLIYTHDPQRTAYMRTIVLSILEKFPCRILFIENLPNSKVDFMRGNVSNALIGNSQQAVSCDQINIEVSDSQVPHLPFIILPHLVPDLPLYVIWGDDPLRENPLLSALQKYASRIIYDSESTTDLKSFSKKMLNLYDDGNSDIMDTQWAALAPWRTLLTAVYNSESRLQILKASQRIQISYNNSRDPLFPFPLVRPLLLQAWLASRLGWTFKTQNKKGDVSEFTYRTATQEVKISLIPSDNESKIYPGSILNFDSVTADNHTTHIERLADQGKVVVHIASKEVCDMPFYQPLLDLRKSTNFLKEMFYRRCGDHYRDALKIISEINP